MNMDNLSFQTPPPPPEPKKKTGLAIGIGVGLVVCLCLVVLGAGVGYVVTHPGLLLQLQGTQYTSQTGDWSIYYPKGWVVEESDWGGATFATSQDVFDNGPQNGAGFYLNHTDLSDIPDENLSTPAELLDYFINNEIDYETTVVQDVKSKKIGGYPGAVAVITMVDDYENVTYEIQLSAVMTDNSYYIIMGASTEDVWKQYSSTLNSILSTFKIINP
jgi:hypothetical protein